MLDQDAQPADNMISPANPQRIQSIAGSIRTWARLSPAVLITPEQFTDGGAQLRAILLEQASQIRAYVDELTGQLARPAQPTDSTAAFSALWEHQSQCTDCQADEPCIIGAQLRSTFNESSLVEQTQRDDRNRQRRDRADRSAAQPSSEPGTQPNASASEPAQRDG